MSLQHASGNTMSDTAILQYTCRNEVTGTAYPSSSSFLLTYLLTYSMVQSPSCEANWFAASQEIPRILWNPKVHYRTHMRPPPVPILGQPNLVYIPTPHLPKIHPNIHPSTPRSPQWSLSLRYPHQDPILLLLRPLYSFTMQVSSFCPHNSLLSPPFCGFAKALLHFELTGTLRRHYTWT